ncbi:MAG: SDR family NAD(P)-dependent oxidoreductase, partial [Saprospiraceae bacterium]
MRFSLGGYLKKTRKPVAVIFGAGSKYNNENNSANTPATIRWGLGGALSQRFAKDYTVVLMSRRPHELFDLLEEIKLQGGHAVPIACDVTKDEAVKSAFKKASKIGNIEILIYNAAPPYPPGSTFSKMPLPHEFDPNHLQRGFDVGVTGCLRCVQNIIKPMLEAGKGKILITGATQALRGAAGFSSMSPIKFALRSLSQSLFQAYASRGVHVSHVVIDGPIDSPGIRKQIEKT